jgi:shikimate kinase
LLLRTAFVVCLDAPPEVIESRLMGETGRPLAADWRVSLERRRDAYAAISQHVDTAGKTPEQVAEEIIARWRNAST